MFISQISFSVVDRAIMKMQSDIYRLHKVVMAGFFNETDSSRVLYRVEPEVHNGTMRLLVQSSVRPDWSSLPVNRGVIEARIKEFNPVFAAGDVFRFRLRTNPTVKRDGRRYGLIRDDALAGWLRRNEDKTGACFRSFTAVDEGYVHGEKISGESLHRLSFKVVRFEGVLEVKDAEKFLSTVREGIGPAKGFGCGLISLARA